MKCTPNDVLTVRFQQLDALVPGGLPPSAQDHADWWANERAGSHIHARARLDADWRVTDVNLRGRRVTFERSTK